MAEIGPIEVSFAINEEEFAQQLQQIKQQLVSATENMQQQVQQAVSPFDELFTQIGELITSSFSPEKISQLSQMLKQTSDEAEQFALILRFIKDNIGDLKIDPNDAKQIEHTIDQLNETLTQTQSAATSAAETMQASFQQDSQSVEQLEAELDRLIAQEKRLQLAIQNTTDPELLAAYNRGLAQTRQEMNAIAERLDVLNSEKFKPESPSDLTSLKKNTQQIDEIKTLNTAISGLFGTVSATITAMQMLSGEDQELGKTMMKLFSVFTIVMGVEQALNLVKQTGNIITAAQAAISSRLAAARVAEAESTEAATAAQLGLNAAMEANPAGILIVALTALITVIATLISKTKDEIEVQTSLYEAQSKLFDIFQKINALQGQNQDEAISKAKNELALAEARGESQERILALKLKENAAELDKINYAKGYYATELKNLDLNKAILQQLLVQASALEQQQLIAGKLSKKDEQRLNLLNAQIKYYQSQVDVAEKIRQDELKAEGEREALLAEQQRQRIEAARRSAIAQAEARAEAMQEGTAAWLQAELNAIETRRRIALQDVNLTKGEREKILVESQKQEQEAILKNKQYELTQQEELIKAKLNTSKKGSLEELNARMALIQLEAEKELAQSNVTAEKKLAIEASRQKQINDLVRQYNLEQAEDEISIKRATINQRLSQVQQGSAAELQLRKQLIDLEQNEEVAKAKASIDNETFLQAKIAEIYANALQKKRQLDEQYLQEYYQQQLQAIQLERDQKSIAYESMINNPNVSDYERVQAQIALTEVQRLSLLKQLQLAQTSYTKALQGGYRDVDRYAQAIHQIQAELKRLEQEQKQLQQQRIQALFADIAQSAQILAEALGDLADALQLLNPGLSDTLQTLGQIAGSISQFAQGGASLAGGISSGNPILIVQGIASVVKGLTGVFKIFSEAKESAHKAAAEIKSYQDQLIRGEIQYNELLRERARTQGDIMKMTVAELQARMQMLNVQKQQALADYNQLLRQIQTQGQQIVGEHTEKYGGFLGIGKKTRVVQDLQNLGNVTYDQLEKLYTEGKLTDETKQWFEALQKVHDEMGDIDQQLADVNNQIKESLTGTTQENIADSIIQGLAEGKRAVADFAQDFQNLMKQAILNSLKEKVLEGPLQEFYNQFAQMTESGGGLTASEVAQLQDMYNNIINNAETQFDELKQIANLNFNNLSDNGLSGAIKQSITEDTANELAGLMRGQYDTIKREFQLTGQMLNVQLNIETHTANTVAKLDLAIQELKNIVNNTKPAMTMRDIGG